MGVEKITEKEIITAIDSDLQFFVAVQEEQASGEQERSLKRAPMTTVVRFLKELGIGSSSDNDFDTLFYDKSTCYLHLRKNGEDVIPPCYIEISNFSFNNFQYYRDMEIFPSPEEWFVFDKQSKTITHINSDFYPQISHMDSIAVPYKIDGVEVEAIGNGTTALNYNSDVYGEDMISIKFEIPQIILPENLKRINDYCFAGWTLDSINVPEKCVKIGKCAFETSNISMIRVSEGNVMELGEGAFSSVSGLKSVDALLKRVENVPSGAFENATEISEIVIPKNVKRIGSSAFVTMFTKLVSVTILNNNCAITDSFRVTTDNEIDFPVIGMIICSPNSTAEIYAKEKGVKYAYNYIDPTSFGGNGSVRVTLSINEDIFEWDLRDEATEVGAEATSSTNSFIADMTASEVYKLYQEGKDVVVIDPNGYRSGYDTKVEENPNGTTMETMFKTEEVYRLDSVQGDIIMFTKPQPDNPMIVRYVKAYISTNTWTMGSYKADVYSVAEVDDSIKAAILDSWEAAV